MYDLPKYLSEYSNLLVPFLQNENEDLVFASCDNLMQLQCQNLSSEEEQQVLEDCNRIAKNHEDEYFRYFALANLGFVGTIEEIPLLEKIRDNDKGWPYTIGGTMEEIAIKSIQLIEEIYNQQANK